MYLAVNVENLKLYEPPIIMDDNEDVQIPTIDDFASGYLEELHEDVILDKRTTTSHRGDAEYLQVGIKGTHPSKKNGWRSRE